MPTKVGTEVTLSLHPDNVLKLDGYSEQTKGYVAPLQTAFDLAYQSIGAVYEAREKAAANAAWTPASQILQTASLAEKYQDKVLRSFDTVRNNLESAVVALDKQLTEPLTLKASGSGVPSEIRAHAKSLDQAERMKLLRRAIDSGDVETTTAILGAPDYLSGLSAAEKNVFTRSYHEATQPEIAKRLATMQSGLDLLNERAGLVFKEFEKALGADSAKVARLRKASSAAEQAFIIKDFSASA